MANISKTKPKAKPAKAQAPESLFDTVKTVLGVIIVVLLIRTFAFEPFNIPSGSMIPTLLIGDYVFVSKYSYGYSKYSFPFVNPPFSGRIFETLPKRGDVAVFRLPTDPSIDYIKRIVGLPGDRIQVKGGLLYVNDAPVERSQIADFVDDEYGEPDVVRQYMETLPGGKIHPILQKVDDGPLDNTPVYVVPPDHVFGMGDNRDNSKDSRVLSEVGYIPLENLVGRAEFRFFSFDSNTPWWAVWEWPFAIRYSRLFTPVR
jgi:signal peptidase I